MTWKRFDWYAVLLALFIAGCASGVRSLGSVVLKDGTTIEYIQVGTKGQDGPKIVVIEGYRFDPNANTSEKASAYNAAGPSLTADILRGAASAGVIAGGMVGAAAVLKPAVTKINQTSGGATISGSGNSTNTNTATGGNACNENGSGSINGC